MYSLIFIYFSLFVAIVSAAVIITGMDEIRIQSNLKVEYKYTRTFYRRFSTSRMVDWLLARSNEQQKFSIL